MQCFRVNKLVNEGNNGQEVSSIDSGNELNRSIEVENQSNDEINPNKRGKRIRKRKRKQATGNDVEIQEASRTIEPDVTVQPKKLLKETKKLFTELSLTNDVPSSKKNRSHIRSVSPYITVETHQIIILSP